MDEAKKGKQVAIRIDTPPGRPPRQVDKHFSAKSPIVSRVRAPLFVLFFFSMVSCSSLSLCPCFRVSSFNANRYV